MVSKRNYLRILESRLFNSPVCLKLKCQVCTSHTCDSIINDIVAQDVEIGHARRLAIIIIICELDGIFVNLAVGELNRDGCFFIRRSIYIVVCRYIDLKDIVRNLPERKGT